MKIKGEGAAMKYDDARMEPFGGLVSPLSTVSSLSTDAKSARRRQAARKYRGERRYKPHPFPTSRRHKKLNAVASESQKKADIVTTKIPMSPDYSHDSFFDEETYKGKNHSFFTYDESRLAHSEQLSDDEIDWQHLDKLKYQHPNGCWSGFFTSAVSKLHPSHLCSAPSSTWEYEYAYQSAPEEGGDLKTAGHYRNTSTAFTASASSSETSINIATNGRKGKEMRKVVSSDETLIIKNLGMQGIHDKVATTAHVPSEAPADMYVYTRSLMDNVEQNESVRQVASQSFDVQNDTHLIAGARSLQLVNKHIPHEHLTSNHDDLSQHTPLPRIAIESRENKALYDHSRFIAKEPCNLTSNNESSTCEKMTIQDLKKKDIHSSIFRYHQGPSSPCSRSVKFTDEQSVQSKYSSFSEPGNPSRIQLLSGSIDYEEIGNLPTASQTSEDVLVLNDNDDAMSAPYKALLQSGFGLFCLPDTILGPRLFHISESPNISGHVSSCESHNMDAEHTNTHEFEFHDKVEVCIGATSSAALELQNEKGMILLIAEQSSDGVKR